MKVKQMIERMVNEIRTAMENELYLSALALALTLPDTCGKAEYPYEEYNGKRYKNWCKKYVIKDKCDSPYTCNMPYLNEEIIYSLRNSLLHQSTPNVEKSDISKKRCKVDKFELVASNSIDANGDLSMIAYGAGMKIVRRELQVHISHLCYILCEAAESYYKNNKEKFNFINYYLVDEKSDETF